MHFMLEQVPLDELGVEAYQIHYHGERWTSDVNPHECPVVTHEGPVVTLRLKLGGFRGWMPRKEVQR